MRADRTLRSLAVALLSCAAANAQLLHRPSWVSRGSGCGQSDNAVFELFSPGAFDLDGSGAPGGAHCLEWTPNGRGSYVVDRGGGLLPYGCGIDTAAGIRAVVGPWNLGFTFAYPGGSTTAVDLAPAGYVYLLAGTNPHGRCCSGTLALPDFLSATPSFAVLGQNLNVGPNGAGTIWFDTAAVGGLQVAYFTWDRVAEGTDPCARNTCQLQLWSDGRCVMCWNGAANRDHAALVGWSAGGGQPDLGSEDLSALPIDGGDGAVQLPAGLEPMSPSGPWPGVNYFFAARSFVQSQLMGAVLLVGSDPRAVPLDSLGMDSCVLMTSGNLAAVPPLIYPAGNPGWTFVTFVPDAPSSRGLELELQAALLVPGANQLGVVLSDAASVTIGYLTLTAPTTGIIADAFGDSNQVDPQQPFWSVIHADPTRPNIVSVRFDYAAATYGPAVLQSFRTDHPQIRFDAGNSALPTCRGTYRNGSDVTTGLVYAGTAAAGCDSSATTGWIGTNRPFPTLYPGDYRTLSFAFTDFQYGERFEFDCATRGGGSSQGPAMEGIIVTIGFADGSTVSGELVDFALTRAIQAF